MDQGVREFEATLATNHGRNSWYICADAMFFGLGHAALFPFTIVPAFLQRISGSEFVAGGSVALLLGGLHVAQIVSCWLYDGHQRKSPPFLGWLMVQRGAVMLLPLAALLAVWQPALAVGLFLLLWTVNGIAWGMNAPLYLDLLGRWLRDDKRGQVLGLRFLMQQVGVVSSGLLVWLVLQRASFPYNYAAVFGAGILFWMASFVPLLRLREAHYPASNPRHPLRVFLADVGAGVRADGSFRRAMLTFALASSFGMLTGLYPGVAAKRYFPDGGAAYDGYMGNCNLLMGLSLGLAAVVAGQLLRRWHNWRVLAIGYAALAAAALNAWLAPDAYTFALTFAFSGFFLGIDLCAGIDMLLKLAPVQHRMRYIAVINTLRGALMLVFPFVGAALVRYGSYASAFLVAAALAGAALVLALTARPTVAKAHD